MSRADSVRRRDLRMATGVLVLAAVAVLAPHVRVGSGQPPPPERAGRVVRYDPRFDRLVTPGSTLEKVAGGFTWVEGPVWDAARGTLLVSDIPKNSVFEWRDGPGLRLFMNPSGYTGTAPFAGREPGSNGLAFDADKRLVLCEHGDRRIARLEVDGRKTTLADRYEGKRLNSPNDLVFARNGDLYFTDPPLGLPKGLEDPGKELGWSGVYRLTPEGRLTLLTRQLRAPVALRGDGSIQCLQARADIERFFQAALDGYYRDGCRASRFIDLDVVPMGGRSVLGTVTWQLLGEKGSVLKEWRQSYNLVRVEKGWQILASTYHVG